MSLFRILCVFPLILFAASQQHAKATEFSWKDPMSGASLLYPDTWTQVHNQKPDDVLTIAAPWMRGRDDIALCRMRVREDKRFSIYPVAMSSFVQEDAYNDEFWADYVGEYDNAVINQYRSKQGLGRGFGSMIDFSYISTYGPKMARRGMAHVSLYDDKAYIFECSSKASAYEAWHPLFSQILSTVHFKKTIHEHRGGHYRRLDCDKPLHISNGPGREPYVY